MLDARPRATERATRATTRRYLMCEPSHFAVVYTINPWMDPARGSSAARAVEQWHSVRAAYEAVGHRVDDIEAAPNLPDMVFAANSAVVADGVAWLARFRHEERRGEEALYADWFRAHGFEVRVANHVHEGEGDFALAGDVFLAGTGFRTELAAHREAERVFDREVVTLELVDPRYYHLDTALFVLDSDQIAYNPAAFSDASVAELRRRFPDAYLASTRDAEAFGCNATCDGGTVFLPAGADDLAAALDRDGFTVVPLDLSELRKAGGSVKCCTLELREAR
jgi:N-dimethylarginine dimethylaminohydrolase